MLFTKLKLYGAAVVATLLGFLLAAVKILSMQKQRAKHDRDRYRSDSERTRKHLEDSGEIEKDRRSRSAEIAREIEETGTSDELDDPNDWEWMNEDT